MRSADQADGEIRRGLRQAVGDACSDGAAEARQRAPIRSGKLASSIKGRVVAGGENLVVGFVEAEAPHAVFVEENTRAHDIPNAFGWGITVRHPGTTAQPFMAPSVPVVEASLETHTQAAAARAVAKF